MKLEYGKRYVNGNGKTTGPLIQSSDSDSPFLDPKAAG
jgi:hypothetical protein